MFCTNCGAELKDGTKFCTNCGQAVSSVKDQGEESEASKPIEPEASASAPADPAASDQTADPAASIPAPAAPVPVEPAQADPLAATSSAPAPAPQAKASRTPVIIVVCAVIVVVVAAILLWLFAFGGARMFAGDEPSGRAAMDAPAHKDDDDKVNMPSLEGLSLSSALDLIDDAGLEVGTITEQSSSDVPKGNVISQSVAAYKTVPEESAVDLVVSTGAPEYTYQVVGGLRTWEEAEAYCEQHGGELACISDQSDWNKVLAAAKATNYKVFWLGGYMENGSYRWVDGSPFAFNAWASGEPNNDQGIEDKLVLFDVNGSWAWYDVPNDLGTTYSPDKCALIMQVEKK